MARSAGHLILAAFLLCQLLILPSANAAPGVIGSQKPFRLPNILGSSNHGSHNKASYPALDRALKSLSGVSQQVVETFESVMSELGSDVFKHLTWTLPHKDVVSRPDREWRYRVSSDATPEHSLRIREPKNLGVDDVKQVRIATSSETTLC
jgi:hypothetical protein